MADPSVLAYARYFGLATDSTQTDLLQFLPEPPAINDDSNDTNHAELETLIASIHSAANKQLRLASEDMVEPPTSIISLLAEWTDVGSPPQSGYEVYSSILPPPTRPEQLKLLEPLLTIGSGEVQRDVQRVRRGINLKDMVNDVFEDHTGCWDSSIHSTGTKKTNAGVLRTMVNYIEKQMDQDRLQVSSATVQYLQGVLQPYCVVDTRGGKDHLPTVEAPVNQLPPDLQAANFELDDCTTSARIEENLVETLPACESRSQATPLAQQKVRPSIGTVSPYVDDHSQSTYMNQGSSETSLNSPLSEDVRLCGNMDWSSSIELTPKPSLCKELRTAPREQPCEKEGQIRGSLDLTATNSMKVEDLQSPAEQSQLSTINVEQCLEAVTVRHTRQESCASSEHNGFATGLPLKVPTLEDLVDRYDGSRSIALERYLDHRHLTVGSENLLYRDPQIGLMPKNLEVHRLRLDDLEISDSASNSTNEHDIADSQETSTSLRMTLTPNTDPTRKYNNVTDVNEDASVVNDRSADYHTADCSGDFRSSDTKVVFETSPATTKSTFATRDIIDRKRKRPVAETEVAATFEGSISTFLDFRGKFPKSSRMASTSSSVEQSSESSVVDGSAKQTLRKDPDDPRSKEDQLIADNRPPPAMFPPRKPLRSSKFIIANTSVLQTKPLLARFLETGDPMNLAISYYDLDTQCNRGPDLILSPTTCLFIVSMQSLGQRALPGKKSVTSLSSAHDIIASLADQYEQIVVLVLSTVAPGSHVDAKMSVAMAEFAEFGANISKDSNAVLLPLWLPTLPPAQVADAVNAWVWEAIRHYGYTACHADHEYTSLKNFLLEDIPTALQISLVKVGLNIMTAIMVEIELRKFIPCDQPSQRRGKFGLGRKVSEIFLPDGCDMLTRKIGIRAVQKVKRAVMADLV